MTDCDPQVPTAEELAQIGRASEADAAAVDRLLLKHCTTNWQKVAMVVARCRSDFDAQCPHLPYIYMPIRISLLAHRGLVEIEGTVMSMRTSEVRLPSTKNDA